MEDSYIIGFPKLPTKQDVENWLLPYFISGAVFLGGVLSFVEFIPLNETFSKVILSLITNLIVDPANISYDIIILIGLSSFMFSNFFEVTPWVSTTSSSILSFLYLKNKMKS